jgi:hypothetical protein
VKAPQSIIELVRRLGFRKRGYQVVFGVPGTAGHAAFSDLARYCCFFEGEVAKSHDETLIRIGRREAFLYIWKHLNLTTEELAALYRSAYPTLISQQGEE